MNQKVRGLSFFSSGAQPSSQRSRVSGFCVVIFVTLINEEGRQNNWSRSINCFELKRRLREGITIYLCNFVTGHRNFLSLEPGLSSPGPRALITPGDIGGGSSQSHRVKIMSGLRRSYFMLTQNLSINASLCDSVYDPGASTRCGIIILFSVSDSQRFVCSLYNIGVAPLSPLTSTPSPRLV